MKVRIDLEVLEGATFGCLRMRGGGPGGQLVIGALGI
jgi:hypothetical protein